MTENPMEFHEQREHADHAATAHSPLIARASITIALFAVATAIVGSIESMETAGAILQSNRAALLQAQASDQWAFFQAKGIKKRLDEAAAEAGGPDADKARAKARQEGEDQIEITKAARALERQRDEARAESDLHEARHPKLTLAAALLQISIAVSTVTIITRRSWPWYLALLAGAGGIGLAALTLLA